MAKITDIQRNYNDDDNLIVSAKLDGILFTNISNEDVGLEKTGIMSRKNNNWVNSANTELLPAVNAVDIDWNGAVLKIA